MEADFKTEFVAARVVLHVGPRRALGLFPFAESRFRPCSRRAFDFSTERPWKALPV